MTAAHIQQPIRFRLSSLLGWRRSLPGRRFGSRLAGLGFALLLLALAQFFQPIRQIFFGVVRRRQGHEISRLDPA
jgi:hypothetical protein